MISTSVIKAFIRTHNSLQSNKKDILKSLEKIIRSKPEKLITKPVKPPMPAYIDMRGHVDRF